MKEESGNPPEHPFSFACPALLMEFQSGGISGLSLQKCPKPVSTRKIIRVFLFHVVLPYEPPIAK
jgi:hypothetical protein